MAAVEFRHGGRAEAGLVEPGVIDPAPDGKALRVFAVFPHNCVESRTDPAGKDDGFLKTDFIHRAHPTVHIGVGGSIVVRMYIDDGISGFLDARFGNFEDGARFVVFEQDFLGWCLGRRAEREAADQKNRAERGERLAEK